jgi:hypothetical protein
MNIKFKLSIWVIVIMAAAVIGITILLLREVSKLSLNLNLRSMEHLSGSNTNNNKEVVGGLGCLLVIDVIQRVLENTLKTNDKIALMAVYSYDGTILAHSKPERIGRNILDVDVELGDSMREILEAMKNGKVYNGIKYDPLLDDNIRFLVKPVQIGDSNCKFSVLIGVSESYVLREIKAVTRFTILMALIAVLVTAAVILIVFGFITKPIITITDTIKNIPDTGNELSGNMARTAAILTIPCHRVRTCGTAGYRRWRGNLLYSLPRSGFLGPYPGNKCS